MISYVVEKLKTKENNIMETAEAKKKESLTDEDRIVLQAVNEEWKGAMSWREIDQEKVTGLIGWLYEYSGHSKPEVIFVQSPMAAQKKAVELTGENKFHECGSSVGIEEYAECAMWDFYLRIGTLTGDSAESAKNLIELNKCGIFLTIQLEQHCIVCENPVEVNENGETFSAKKLWLLGAKSEIESNREPFLFKWRDGFEATVTQGKRED